MVDSSYEKFVENFDPRNVACNIEILWKGRERLLPEINSRFRWNAPMHEFRSYVHNPYHMPETIKFPKSAVLNTISTSSYSHNNF